MTTTVLFIVAVAVVVALLIVAVTPARRTARRVPIDEARRREQAVGSAEATGLDANARKMHNRGIL